MRAQYQEQVSDRRAATELYSHFRMCLQAIYAERWLRNPSIWTNSFQLLREAAEGTVHYSLVLKSFGSKVSLHCAGGAGCVFKRAAAGRQPTGGARGRGVHAAPGREHNRGAGGRLRRNCRSRRLRSQGSQLILVLRASSCLYILNFSSCHQSPTSGVHCL